MVYSHVSYMQRCIVAQIEAVAENNTLFIGDKGKMTIYTEHLWEHD